ncbi:transmembrane protein, putative [Bodo saltans]|nr:transmembrane protein, putative [Bodo saltans]|eukprot:CUI14462.1 transmembrane protein, putative [Bodo saltans]
MGTATNPGVMAQSTSCSNTTNWPSDCDSYCSAHDSSVTACINDVSCQWENLRCVPRPVSGCASLATQAACSASDMCSWDTTLLFCKDAPQACRFSTNANCITAPQCVWRTGMNTNALAGSLGLGARLVNPGQSPTYPFSTLSINSQDMFYGASVSIENGYQLGKDVLTMTYPTSVSTTWVPQSGLLQFSGAATAAEYGFVIRAVKFQTSSLASGARNLTWTLGNGTLFSLSTGHYYRYYPQRGITWDNAKFACLATSHYGLSGYLATITATAENSIVATKLGADGWLSGDDGTRSQWQLSTGPESGNLFWIGGSMTAGGYTATGAYANWNNMDGEPKRASSQISHVYLNQSGYWSAKVTNDPTSAGYVCEYGGQATDLPTLSYAIAGGSVIGSSGCLPSTPCIYHGSSDLCNADSQCTWYKSSCVVGCGTYSTVAECNSGSNCVWDTTVLPPVCSENTCASLGVDVCSTQPQCTYQASSGCTLRTGCAQYTAAGSCNAQSSCTWSGTPGECGNRPCSALTVQSSCTNNPLCQWSQVTGCSTILCTYGNQAECSADTSCVWSLPDTTSVEFYGGGQQIAPFANAPILSPTDGNLMTQGVTVMITKGFQVGDDVLSVDSQDNLGNTWIVSWNAATGVLNLRVAPGVQMRAITAFSQMKSIVKFSSASSTQIRRTLSYVLAASTYSSPSTGLLYKALPSVFVNTYTKALQACASSTLLGVSGSLAVILSQQDNLAIRSLGASGFIGATSVDNVWRWSGNASMSFWTGYGSNGQPVAGSFSSWSAGEPMRTNIYAVLNPSGSWKSVPSNNVVNYGVVCQYQPPANQDVASSYNIKPAGCFALPCVGLPMVSCSSDPQCNWVNGGTTAYCAVDTFCSVSTDMSTCVIREQCYWDFVYGSCRSAATSVCSALTSTVTCGLFTQCKWTSAQTMVPRNGSAVGFCRSIGCSTYPNMDSCTGDANCLWNTITNAAGQCVGRVCGYTASGQCWTDPSCQWSPIASTCTKSSCSSLTQGQCTGQCQFDATQGQCVFTRCSDPSRTMCLSDSACLYTMAKGCYMTQCLSYADKDSCQADANCYYSFSDPQQCVASQCLSLENTTSCSANSKTCAWTTNPTGFSYCKELSFLAQFAPSSTPNTCTRQVFDPAWWLWAIMVVDFVLLCAILYRIYLAFSAGMSFFQQVRRTKKYDYSQYAADLFQDAQDYGAENNGVNYARPSLNDL